VHRKEVKRKGQSIAQQVKVQAKDRMRLVSIIQVASEKKRFETFFP
jgi:NADH-quinone oxidoreductase subunit J